MKKVRAQRRTPKRKFVNYDPSKTFMRSLQNISQILNGDAMHDETQNYERDKAGKHAKGNERGESLKACTK